MTHTLSQREKGREDLSRALHTMCEDIDYRVAERHLCTEYDLDVQRLYGALGMVTHLRNTSRSPISREELYESLRRVGTLSESELEQEQNSGWRNFDARGYWFIDDGEGNEKMSWPRKTQYSYIHGDGI